MGFPNFGSRQVFTPTSHTAQGYSINYLDLKSLNILIDSDKRIRICDFGVSKVLKATLDSAQTMIGTPYYFSPELIEVGH